MLRVITQSQGECSNSRWEVSTDEFRVRNAGDSGWNGNEDYMKRTLRKTIFYLLALASAMLMVASACSSGDSAETAEPTPPAASPTTAATGGDGEATTEPAPATSGGGEDVSAALVFDIGGRGDGSFNDAAAAGLDRAEDQLGVQTSEVSPNVDGSNRAEILQLSADQGADVVIGVGFLFGETIHNVAKENPDTFFGVIDDAGMGPNFDEPVENLAGLTFAEHEGSFLVGAAAALKSQTGTVGFIGGVDIQLIRKFHAGFEAGVKTVNPNISILAEYVTEPPNFDGWGMPAEAKVIAESMYENGADVIYHAAGGSGAGLFEAARDYSESTGEKVWAIGVDSDQYFTSDESVQPYILTSMLKRVDVAVYNTIEAVVNGDFTGNGATEFNLAVNGVGYSISGGFIDDIIPQLEEYKQAIVGGSIFVPVTTERGGGEDVSAALVFDIGGRGDGSFNDAAAAGLDRAEDQLGVQTSEVSPNVDGSNRAEILQLSADQGADVVIGVGFLFGETIHNVAKENPDTFFGVIDDAGMGPNFDEPVENLAGLTFAEHEGSFLVGAAAALKSQTGTVGFIGGVDIQLIRKFHAGFEAGVKTVNPNISILAEYVTEPPNFDGWGMPAEAKVIAESMYENGADVIYHAAGGSGAGLFEAARDYSESTGEKVWAIGVDSDQYFTSDESVQPYILTSMLKRVDVAVYNTIEAVVDGEFKGNGATEFNLAVNGVGYSISGGFIDDIIPQLEEYKQAIVRGEIEVPVSTDG